MSKRFKITVMAEWQWTAHGCWLQVGNITLGKVRPSGTGYVGVTIVGNDKLCKSIPAAKRYVIKSLATPEGGAK